MAEELWKSIVRVAAPALGAAVVGTVTGGLGAPVGGMIASMLAEEVLGPDASGAKPASQRLSEAFASPTPQMISDLQKAALSVQVRLKQLDIDLERIAADDLDSARRREVETKDWIPGALSVGVTLGFFGLLALVMFYTPPDGSRDLLNVMIGALGAAWTSIIAYYFGSSSGSAAKNATIDGLTKFYPTSADATKPKQEFF